MPVISPTPELRLSACERPAGFPVMRQRWAGLFFAHWPVDPGLVAGRLPSGLHVDTYGGSAWLGVVPFFMQRVRPLGLPPLPWLSWFHELNVRTYVHDSHGNPAVWFFSLDCNQPLAVEIARRMFHLPYEHAAMRSLRVGDGISYFSRRKSHDMAETEFRYDLPAHPQEAEPGSLDWFLVERYRLFSCDRSGRIFSGRVHHRPYQISPAPDSRWSTEPLRLNGFSDLADPQPRLHTAATVDVDIFPLTRHQL
jgi:uncharacterized protein YqjF (DUF2071 family)